MSDAATTICIHVYSQLSNEQKLKILTKIKGLIF